MGYSNIVTADDIAVAGKFGVLLDPEFVAQDLPELPHIEQRQLARTLLQRNRRRDLEAD